jgi:hypothetical protein
VKTRNSGELLHRGGRRQRADRHDPSACRSSSRKDTRAGSTGAVDRAAIESMLAPFPAMNARASDLTRVNDANNGARLIQPA